MTSDNSLFCLKTRKFNDIPIKRPHKWTIYIIGLLETFIFGGCIFGWAQLVYVLKNEEIFLDRCQIYNSNLTTKNVSEVVLWEENIKMQGCPEQDKEFALIYMIACLFYGAVAVLSGMLLHHCGLVVSRILASLALCCGFLALSFTTKEQTFWLYVSMILLAYGGNQLRFSGLQFCNLFPKNKSTALTIICGTYAASSGLFLIFQLGQNNGLSLWAMSLPLALLAFLSLLATVLMPWHHIPYEQSKQSSEQSMQLKNSIFSKSAFTHVYWFVILVFALRIYTLVFNPWISKISETNEEAGFYSYMLSVSAFCCPLVTPFPGMLNDYFSRRAKLAGPNKQNIFQKDLKSPVMGLVIMTAMTVGLMCCLMFYHPIAVYASLVILVIIRPCIISVAIAFVRIRFPPEHFDRLNGISDTLISLTTPLLYPFFLWIQNSLTSSMICFIILIILTLVQPLHLLSRRYRSKIAEERFQNYSKDEGMISSEKSEDNEKC